MKILASALLLLLSMPLLSQNVPAASPNPWSSLDFLQGSWQAKTQGNASVTASGMYTFSMELGNHILARHSIPSSCKGPETFHCDHGDLLYVYEDDPGQPLKAIYFDNEGHVIHYDVATPTPTTVIFLSDASQVGPRFRLIYELKDAIMFGKFQVQMPGQSEWSSYLEWSGAKVKP